MNHARLTIALGLAALTAACGKKAEAPVATETNEAEPAATMSGDMGNMSMAPDANAAIKAKGHGTVTAIDKAAGTITLDHGPIPEAKWPAMTMAFKAAPSITDAVKVGDKVDFDLSLKGSDGEVTAIAKQGSAKFDRKKLVASPLPGGDARAGRLPGCAPGRRLRPATPNASGVSLRDHRQFEHASRIAH
nr:copper-binding protein [Sphingomonas koreensis]